MKRIRIDKIEDGQILAQPVVDDFGNVIMNTGFILSNAWSARLQTRKIEYVFVEEDVEVEQVASKTDKMEKATHISDRINKLFKGTLKDERMKYLAIAAKKYHLKRELDS